MIQSNILLRTALTSVAVFFTVFTSAANAQEDIRFEEDGVAIDVGDISAKIAGRVQLDSVFADEEFGGDDTDIRRARIEFAVELPEDVRLRADYDFAPGREGFRNLWAEYRGLDGVNIRAGQFVVPFSIEEMMESNDLMFMERSLPGTLAPGFNAGAALATAPGNWSLQAGMFFDPIDGSEPSGKGTSVVGRAVYRPVDKLDRVLHLGASLEYRDLADSSEPRFSARQELSLGRARLDTRGIDEAKTVTGLAMEAIYLDGPLLVQTQAFRRNVRTEGLSPIFLGGYIQAGWLFGKGERGYSRSNGIPTAVRPKGSFGAFEIGLRVSHLDLSDALVSGGRETNYGLALNWYPTYNLRFSINLIQADIHEDRSGDQVSKATAQTRLQLRF